MACFPRILAEPQTFDCLSDAHFWPKAAVAADTKRLETIFKDIHQNPELGFMEVRTAGIIAEELTNLGFDIQTGIGETGVVGVFRNGQGPTVMYRADMDANAFEEASGLS
jgi:hippurate hydrolase